MRNGDVKRPGIDLRQRDTRDPSRSRVREDRMLGQNQGDRLEIGPPIVVIDLSPYAVGGYTQPRCAGSWGAGLYEKCHFPDVPRLGADVEPVERSVDERPH